MSEHKTEQLTIEDLTFEIRRSAWRKSLSLIIDRGGELIIAAPQALDTSSMEHFVREKRFWLYTKLAQKELLLSKARPKEYVNGEGFSYLGRSYRLLLTEGQGSPLKLEAGRFRLLHTEAAQGRGHFVEWYKSHAAQWLKGQVKRWSPRLEVEVKRIQVRELGFRWGSCGKSGTVNFHWAVIRLPASMIEYVVVHELVHRHEANHTPEFWRRVERAMPDYAQRKAWLAEHGAEYTSL